MLDPTSPQSLAQEFREIQRRLSMLERAQRMPPFLAKQDVNPDALTPPSVFGAPTSGRAGPRVTLDVPASGQVLASLSLNLVNPGDGSDGTFDAGLLLTGANTGTREGLIVSYVPPAATPLVKTLSASISLTGLTPGSTVFETRYTRTGTTCTIEAGTSRLTILVC
jgi:hypothetical protein